MKACSSCIWRHRNAFYGLSRVRLVLWISLNLNILCAALVKQYTHLKMTLYSPHLKWRIKSDSSLILEHLSVEMKIKFSTLCKTTADKLFGTWPIVMFIMSWLNLKLLEDPRRTSREVHPLLTTYSYNGLLVYYHWQKDRQTERHHNRVAYCKTGPPCRNQVERH